MDSMSEESKKLPLLSESLEGAVAVISGGNSGIGRGVALGFARAGLRTVIAGRNADKCNAVVEEIEKAGGQALAVTCDVTQPESVVELMRKSKQAYGTVDVLFANSGISAKQLGNPMPDTLLNTGHDVWKKVIDVNLNGAYYCANEAAKIMAEQGRGHIIYMASQAAGWIYDSPCYGVSKSAMAVLALHTHGFFEKLNKQNERASLFSHVICPGLVDTPWFEGTKLPEGKALSTDDVSDLALSLMREPQKPRSYFEAMSKSKPYCVGPIGLLEHDIVLRIFKDPSDA